MECESILVIADMVDAFDREEPKPGRETTAFVKRWRSEEMKLKHTCADHLTLAVRNINSGEIQNIRETKKYRDEQRARKVCIAAPACSTIRD